MDKLRHRDGWYNGHPELMIPNGTYADFRDRIVSRVNNGFYDRVGGKGKGEKLLAEWDSKWEAIPLVDRLKARSVVIQDSTPKLQVIDDELSGKRVKALRARPSAGNNLELDRFKPKVDVQRKRRLSAIPLSDDNNPITELPIEASEKRAPGRPKKLSEDNNPLVPSA